MDAAVEEEAEAAVVVVLMTGQLPTVDKDVQSDTEPDDYHVIDESKNVLDSFSIDPMQHIPQC